MLNVEIKHDINKNYLVIQGNEETAYMVKMLEENSIKGFLDLEVRVLDNQNQYYYDITGKESLTARSGREKWNGRQLLELFSQVLRVIGKSREYLLSPDHFLLQPEYVYQDMENGKVSICYAWEYEENINQQLSNFFSYFMNVLEYEDKSGVELVYRMYEYSREENCTLQRLWSGLAETEVALKNSEEESGFRENISGSDEVSLKGSKMGKWKSEKMGKYVKKEKKEFQMQNTKDISLSKEAKKTSKCLNKKNAVNVKAGTESEQGSLGRIKKFSLTVGLQILLLGGIYAGGKSGLFLTEGGLSYLKSGVIVIISGMLDLYLLAKIFGEKQVEEKIVKEKIIEEKQVLSEGEEQKKGYMSVFNKSYFAPAEKENICMDGTAILNYKDVEEHKFCPKEELRENKKTCGCYLFPCADEGSIIQISKFPFFIGRFQKDTNELYESKNISRMHCKIDCVGGEYYVVDLNSTNGTYVNEIKLQQNVKKRLEEGDRVCFADVGFRFSKKMGTI